MLSSYKLCIDDTNKLAKDIRKTMLEIEGVKERSISKIKS